MNGDLNTAPGMLLEERPEWGRSTPLQAHEQANLEAFSGVFPHWNARDIPAMLEYYEDDISWHNIATGEVFQGKAAVGGFLQELFTALPDFRLEVTLRLPRGEYVAEEYVIAGTHLGPMFGIPATGRPIRLRAMSMVRMRNGRLLEDHFYFDLTSALQQMGLFPGLDAARRPLGRAALALAVHRRRAALGAGLGLAAVAAGLRRRRRRRS
jgi:steroid delta-isomerase-like uncharacterized protein